MTSPMQPRGFRAPTRLEFDDVLTDATHRGIDDGISGNVHLSRRALLTAVVRGPIALTERQADRVWRAYRDAVRG